jgi:hypothetical protein
MGKQWLNIDNLRCEFDRVPPHRCIGEAQGLVARPAHIGVFRITSLVLIVPEA